MPTLVRLLPLFVAIAAVPGLGAAGSRPIEFTGGEVFRDFTYRVDDSKRTDLHNPSHFGEVDPGSKRDNLKAAVARSRAPRPLNLDLTDATRAELYVEYWGGHPGSSGQLVRINEAPWRPIPQPVGTPDDPAKYYRMVLGGSVLPVDLQDLKQGENIFRFTVGPQLVKPFDWGFYWIYSFTVRVYHPRTAAHATGRIVLPSRRLAENPAIEVAVTPGAVPVRRVDVIAHTEDFNVSGSGRPAEWQHQLQWGVPHAHVGTAAAAPYRVQWNTRWLPDQSRPMKLVALIVDEHGFQSVTPVEDGLILDRPGRSVVIARAGEIPFQFGVRNGEKMECAINVPPVEGRLTAARLKVSFWCGNHLDELHLNDHAFSLQGFGRYHDHQIEDLAVPLEAVKTGRNAFRIASRNEHHMAEVNWPGPVLLLEYAR